MNTKVVLPIVICWLCGNATLLTAQMSVDTSQVLPAINSLYSNRITSRTLPNAYTEVCIKNGAVLNDQHPGGESTAGGNCRFGDVGWIIEQTARPRLFWEEARTECLLVGMRLPEPFEWLYSCKHAAELGLTDIGDDFEWASNTAVTENTDSGSTLRVPALSKANNCQEGGSGFAASCGGTGAVTNGFRCVR
jgi:hypothetical protein